MSSPAWPLCPRCRWIFDICVRKSVFDKTNEWVQLGDGTVQQNCSLCQSLLRHAIRAAENDRRKFGDSQLEEDFNAVVCYRIDIKLGIIGLQVQFEKRWEWTGPGFEFLWGVERHFNQVQLSEAVSFLLKGSPLRDLPLWRHQYPQRLVDRISRVQQWMDDCTRNHPNCQFRPIDRFVRPKRLIDMGEGTKVKTWRLVDTLDLPNPKYIALSHCWGPRLAHPPRLTKAKEMTMMHSMRGKDIPKTYLEAGRIAKLLGVRYLWIDSLCIVQDNEEWQSEAAKMMSVYQGSILTLAATDAPDSHTGCFVDARSRCSGGLRVQRTPQKQYSRLLNAPLNRRGWTFQELMLAPRVLHCAADGFYWECNRKFESEDGLITHSFEDTDGLEFGHEEYQNPLLASKHLMNGTGWWSWMLEYSSRNFGCPKDCVAAFAGMTELFESQTGRTPMLGLWLETLYHGLGWKAVPKRLSKKYQPADNVIELPSWSPLGLGVQVANDIDPDEDFFTHWELEVVDHDINWSGKPRVSMPKSTKLIVNGYYREATLRTLLPGLESGPELSVNHGNKFDSLRVNWDPGVEAKSDHSPQRVICLLLYGQSFYVTGTVRETYLVLAQDTVNPDIWRRLGVGLSVTDMGNELLFEGAGKIRLSLG